MVATIIVLFASICQNEPNFLVLGLKFLRRIRRRFFHFLSKLLWAEVKIKPLHFYKIFRIVLIIKGKSIFSVSLVCIILSRHNDYFQSFFLAQKSPFENNFSYFSSGGAFLDFLKKFVPSDGNGIYFAHRQFSLDVGTRH